MLKAGAIILTVSSSFNLLLAGLILILVIAAWKNAPILFIVFAQSEIAKLDTKVLDMTKSLAILFNASAAAFSLLSLFVICGALVKGQHWAFWALLLSAGLTCAMGFVADAAIGTKTLIPNLILALVFLVGISLAGCSLSALAKTS